MEMYPGIGLARLTELCPERDFDHLPKVTDDFLVDGYVSHGEVLEEGAPWRWGDEVKAIPVIPDKTDGSLEPVLGSTPLQREPK